MVSPGNILHPDSLHSRQSAGRLPSMKTRTPVMAENPDSAFPHINGINMEVAVELFGQEIAKLSAAIEAEGSSDNRQGRIRALVDERAALRHRQQDLRSGDMDAVQAVFDDYGCRG